MKIMKTSQQWWDDVKVDSAKLEDWLKKQYHGEVTAAERIVKLADTMCNSKRQKDLLYIIADQETQHANWVKDLLLARGIEANQLDKVERYWGETLPGIEDFATGCAVAAHAEKMRLERIQVISNDITTPADIQEVFTKILKDELFHERAFRSLSTEEALEKTKGNHELGLMALGLVA